MKAYTISLFDNNDEPERKWVVVAATPERAKSLLAAELGTRRWERVEIAAGGDADGPEGVIGTDDED